MSDPCIYCGHGRTLHDEDDGCSGAGCRCMRYRDEPTDDELANRPGVEGGIAYPLGPEPMSEHDWRL